MKCRIDITAATDIAAWVTKVAFMDNVDTDDLACRESEGVFDWYHPDWFPPNNDGELHFIPPAFEFRNGHLRGINGRHRAILLFRHLDVIPMLLVRPSLWPDGKLAEVVHHDIKEGEIVELPDLPTKKLDALDDTDSEQNVQACSVRIILKY